MAVTTRGTRKKQKEELLSLNNPKKPTYKFGDAFESTSNASRTAALKDKLEPRKPASKRKPVYRIGDKYSPNAKSKDNEISQAEMDDIDRQIKKMQKDKKKVTEKDVEKISGKKVVTKNGKKGFLFGKGAKFRPFGGVLARALLGDDEKFGGERGLIDFVRTNKKPVKKQNGGMMKAKGYSRGGLGMSNPSIKLSGGKKTRRSTPAPAPREEKLAAGRRAAAARAAAGYSQRTPSAGSKEAGSSRARSGAGTGRSISELSDAQKRLLRSVQSTGRKQPTSVIDELTKKYGNLAARKQRQNLKKKAPRPPGMRAGGMSMKSKMASKGGKMGGMMPPGYKKGGSVGRKKARGVGAAKRGFGRAMR